jgi:precorrin-3B synthase
LIEARVLAAKIARIVPLTGDGIAIHVSGCGKGCAHQAATSLTVVGTADGCALIANGTARASPVKTVRADNLLQEVAELCGHLRETVDA